MFDASSFNFHNPTAVIPGLAVLNPLYPYLQKGKGTVSKKSSVTLKSDERKNKNNIEHYTKTMTRFNTCTHLKPTKTASDTAAKSRRNVSPSSDQNRSRTDIQAESKSLTVQNDFYPLKRREKQLKRDIVHPPKPEKTYSSTSEARNYERPSRYPSMISACDTANNRIMPTLKPNSVYKDIKYNYEEDVKDLKYVKGKENISPTIPFLTKENNMYYAKEIKKPKYTERINDSMCSTDDDDYEQYPRMIKRKKCPQERRHIPQTSKSTIEEDMENEYYEREPQKPYYVDKVQRNYVRYSEDRKQIPPAPIFPMRDDNDDYFGEEDQRPSSYDKAETHLICPQLLYQPMKDEIYGTHGPNCPCEIKRQSQSKRQSCQSDITHDYSSEATVTTDEEDARRVSMPKNKNRVSMKDSSIGVSESDLNLKPTIAQPYIARKTQSPTGSFRETNPIMPFKPIAQNQYREPSQIFNPIEGKEPIYNLENIPNYSKVPNKCCPFCMCDFRGHVEQNRDGSIVRNSSVVQEYRRGRASTNTVNESRNSQGSDHSSDVQECNRTSVSTNAVIPVTKHSLDLDRSNEVQEYKKARISTNAVTDSRNSQGSDHSNEAQENKRGKFSNNSVVSTNAVIPETKYSHDLDRPICEVQEHKKGRVSTNTVTDSKNSQECDCSGPFNANSSNLRISTATTISNKNDNIPENLIPDRISVSINSSNQNEITREPSISNHSHGSHNKPYQNENIRVTSLDNRSSCVNDKLNQINSKSTDKLNEILYPLPSTTANSYAHETSEEIFCNAEQLTSDSCKSAQEINVRKSLSSEESLPSLKNAKKSPKVLSPQLSEPITTPRNSYVTVPNLLYDEIKQQQPNKQNKVKRGSSFSLKRLFSFSKRNSDFDNSSIRFKEEPSRNSRISSSTIPSEKGSMTVPNPLYNELKQFDRDKNKYKGVVDKNVYKEEKINPKSSGLFGGPLLSEEITTAECDPSQEEMCSGKPKYRNTITPRPSEDSHRHTSESLPTLSSVRGIKKRRYEGENINYEPRRNEKQRTNNVENQKRCSFITEKPNAIFQEVNDGTKRHQRTKSKELEMAAVRKSESDVSELIKLTKYSYESQPSKQSSSQSRKQPFDIPVLTPLGQQKMIEDLKRELIAAFNQVAPNVRHGTSAECICKTKKITDVATSTCGSMFENNIKCNERNGLGPCPSKGIQCPDPTIICDIPNDNPPHAPELSYTPIVQNRHGQIHCAIPNDTHPHSPGDSCTCGTYSSSEGMDLHIRHSPQLSYTPIVKNRHEQIPKSNSMPPKKSKCPHLKTVPYSSQETCSSPMRWYGIDYEAPQNTNPPCGQECYTEHDDDCNDRSCDKRSPYEYCRSNRSKNIQQFCTMSPTNRNSCFLDNDDCFNPNSDQPCPHKTPHPQCGKKKDSGCHSCIIDQLLNPESCDDNCLNCEEERDGCINEKCCACEKKEKKRDVCVQSSLLCCCCECCCRRKVLKTPPDKVVDKRAKSPDATSNCKCSPLQCSSVSLLERSSQALDISEPSKLHRFSSPRPSCLCQTNTPAKDVFSDEDIGMNISFDFRRSSSPRPSCLCQTKTSAEDAFSDEDIGKNISSDFRRSSSPRPSCICQTNTPAEDEDVSDEDIEKNISSDYRRSSSPRPSCLCQTNTPAEDAFSDEDIGKNISSDFRRSSSPRPSCLCQTNTPAEDEDVSDEDIGMKIPSGRSSYNFDYDRNNNNDDEDCDSNCLVQDGAAQTSLVDLTNNQDEEDTLCFEDTKNRPINACSPTLRTPVNLLPMEYTSQITNYNDNSNSSCRCGYRGAPSPQHFLNKAAYNVAVASSFGKALSYPSNCNNLCKFPKVSSARKSNC